MTWLVQHALLVIVVLSALGAAVTSAVAVAQGFTPRLREDDDVEGEEPATDTRRLVTRLGHAIATVCFALIVVLAVLAQIMPASPHGGADQRAEIARLRADVDRLDGRLRETVAPVDEKLAASASPTTADKGQPKSPAATEQASTASAQAPVAPQTPPATTAERPSSARAPASPRRAHRDDGTRAVDLPATPARTRSLTASRSPAPSSVTRSLSEARPPAPMTASTTIESTPPRPSPPPRTARATAPAHLVTTVGDVRVELKRDTEGGNDARVTSYTARLSDLAGRPLVASDVVLVGRMADGTQAEAALDPTPAPGVYTARVAARPEGPYDLVLQVKLNTRRLEVPLE